MLHRRRIRRRQRRLRAACTRITRQAGVPHRRAVLRQPQREGPDGREQRHPRRPARQPAHPAVHRLPARCSSRTTSRSTTRRRRTSGTWWCRTASTATAAWASARSCASATSIAGSLYSEPDEHATTPRPASLYNMLKLSRNLFFHDPDPKYMNYYEQGLFNQILGSRRDADSATSPDGHVLRPGAPGRAPELRQRRHVLRRHGHGEPHEVPGLDLLPRRRTTRRSTSISTSRRRSSGAEKGFTIEQATRLSVRGQRARSPSTATGALDVKLRVPTWVRTGYTVTVNGAAQRIDGDAGHLRHARAGSGGPATGSRSRCRSQLPHRTHDRRPGGAVDLLRPDAAGRAGAAPSATISRRASSTSRSTSTSSSTAISRRR